VEINLAIKSLEKVGVGLFLLDLNTQKIVGTNGYISKMIEYDLSKVNLKTIEFAKNHIHTNDRPFFEGCIDNLRAGEKKVSKGMIRMKNKRGHDFWVYLKVIIFEKDTKGNPEILLGIIVEISPIDDASEQLEEFVKQRIRSKNQKLLNNLSKREIQILPMVAEGKSYTQIAKVLSIQPDTVNHHRKNIFRKLRIKNIPQLVCFAKESGLV
jgi:PAS domain S-box-containing protein